MFRVHKQMFCDASRRVVASVGRLLFYTEDGHSSEDVLVVNPLTGEQKILGVPTLDNGAPLLWRRRRQTGMIMRMTTISLKPMQKMGLLSFSYESELDEISDSGRSEWDEEESADEEGIMLLKPTLNPKSGHRM